jgi:hopanoid C-2 methylase
MLNLLQNNHPARLATPHSQRRLPTKKVLTVTLHFDDTHLPVKRRNKLPQGMGAAFLAGAFAPEHCQIKTYSELYSGPLEDEKLLAWPDMIVLTGVSNCFDRMLHVTAYAKSKNRKVTVVAGGPPVRAFPRYASNFFDYCCSGDIEQLQEVVTDAFGREYVAAEMLPRLDLAYWIGIHGHVETSRYCNFHCNFCALTGEKSRYQKYDLDYLEKQFLLMGKRRTVHFIDNNFYGNDRDFFCSRLDLINRYRLKGHFKYWSALVSSDFFYDEDNLKLAASTGCTALFSGIESFDNRSLHSYNKLQNTKLPQVELISRTLNHGIAFWYGLFMDVYNRPIKDIQKEMDFIFSTAEITLPGFLTIPIPLPGTPYFFECLENGAFFPRTSLRHLDGVTLCMNPLSPLEETVSFISDAQQLKKQRKRILRHALLFYRRYRHVLNLEKMVYALASNTILTMSNRPPAPFFKANSHSTLTHISSSESLESTYTPAFRIDSQYAHYFKATMLTDDEGNITEALAPDIYSYKNRHQKNPPNIRKDLPTQVSA